MKKYVKFIVLGGVVIVLAVVAGKVFVLGPEKVPAKPEAVVSETPSFEQQFEDILNGLLKDTAEKAQDYKTQRKVLGELVNPMNLTSADYVQENYNMMQNTLPALHEKMDKIINQFEEADRAVKALIVQRPPEDVEAVRAEWARLKQDQAGTYIRYFESEEDVLRAYEELMAVYYDTQGRFSVDPLTEEVSFENPQDELAVNQKRLTLKALLRQQSQILVEE